MYLAVINNKWTTQDVGKGLTHGKYSLFSLAEGKRLFLNWCIFRCESHMNELIFAYKTSK